MGGLQGGDDALETGELAKRAERPVVGDGLVAGPAGVAEVGVLGADARVVEAGRDRVRLEDLSVLVREHRRHGAVKDADAARSKRGPVAAGLEPLPPGLDADQLDRIVEERGEEPDRVRAAADASDGPLRQRAL